MVTVNRSGALFPNARVQEMLGLSKAQLGALIEAGFVQPERGVRDGYLFTFQDLMLLRTANTLKQAGITTRKIVRALAKLKSDLPADLPLTGLRITAVGSDVAVRDRTGQWTAETGQRLMDFEVVHVGGAVAFMIAPVETSPAAATSPEQPDWFRRGEALEGTDPAAAEAAYRQAIELEPAQSSAYLNLIAVLCEADRFGEVLGLCERAAEQGLANPLLFFNEAVALDALGRFPEAIDAYARALRLDPALSDAHYNIALIAQRQGDARAALRHFNAYRRLQRDGAS